MTAAACVAGSTRRENCPEQCLRGSTPSSAHAARNTWRESAPRDASHRSPWHTNRHRRCVPRIPPEHPDLRVERDDRRIAVHRPRIPGCTPSASSHLRITPTAPFSVLGPGCGRCNTRRGSNKRINTRDPARSAICPPNARRKTAMSAQRTFADTSRQNPTWAQALRWSSGRMRLARA
jgi:hypothetical protein